MLFTSQSVLLTLSVFSTAWAQPHGHVHQHGASKRATGVVSGRGIVYADGNSGMGALGGKITFSTDWTPWQDNPSNADLGTFVPHVWGLDNPDGDSKKQFMSAFLQAASSFPEGVTILGFNEAEQVGQSWMTPQAAVDNWGGINDLKKSKGAKICTPCPSNGAILGTSGVGTITGQFQSGIDQGVNWMTDFLKKAQGQYTFDCLCMHWYGGTGNSLEADQGLIDSQVKAMADLADQYNIPAIVIGEMGRLNPSQECEFVSWFQSSFLTDSTKYSGSGNKITAYAYNYNLNTLTNGGALTSVGSAYIGEGSC